MEKKTITISERLHNDIAEYCKFNGLRISDFCEKLLSNGFMLEKYGDAPFMQKQNNKTEEIQKDETIIIEEPVEITEFQENTNTIETKEQTTSEKDVADNIINSPKISKPRKRRL